MPLTRAGWFWCVAAAVLVLVAAAAPLITRALGLTGPLVRDSGALNLFGGPTGPSAKHPLGVDTVGRDELARILYALRAALGEVLAGSAAAVLAAWGVSRVVPVLRWIAARLPRRPRRAEGPPYAADEPDARPALLRSARLRRTLGVLARCVAVLLHCVAEGLCSGLASIPATLFGLLIATDMRTGVWSLMIAVGAAAVPGALSATRALPAGRLAQAHHLLCTLIARLPAGLLLVVALTYLGAGQADAQPEFGAMLAGAGNAVAHNVSEWWAVLFPGLALILAGTILRGLAGTLVVQSPAPVTGAARLVWPLSRTVAAGLAALGVWVFAALVGPAHLRFGPGNHALVATLSLLGGGVVVWGLAGTLILTAAVRAPAVVARLPTRALGSIPVAFLGVLSLYLFSNAVGKIALFPGMSTYVAPDSRFGTWLGSLVMPWLVLGLTQVAALLPAFMAAVGEELTSARHRVAAAAGVSPGQLRRDDARAVASTLLSAQRLGFARFLGAAVTVEVLYGIPGLGRATAVAFANGRSAQVAGTAAVAGGVVVALGWLIDQGSGLLDPGSRRR